ncbi:phosphomannomutase/phosphoglucomutase [Streptomyces sp. NBC_00140]|uniref:phosphomannomutase/phosphoglucomutase n=1 Tax=Streptomyces sp. NBC_00140 TaxID=2975664 RepID=UPI00225BE0F2|nr:phosphomannomutase/phosphoglucomutase [Streptomyces sp. NBC_00140]MCX5328134.1 phosphomannomutase/phosphoglucomutase [Streptomyces sp. NBC_00140]
MHRCHPIKAYDVRGHVDDVTPKLARSVGEAFAYLMKAETIVVAQDMRPTSPALAEAFTAGVIATGADVITLGLASTDQVYFASGTLDLPAAVITASHNPGTDNGIKLVGPGASAIARDTGLEDIHSYLHTGRLPNQPYRQKATSSGCVRPADLHDAYIRYVRGLVDLGGMRRLKVVIDAGNGMAGHVVPDLLNDLPLDVIPLYFDLDGTFPNHDANPMDPANLRDLQATVLSTSADLGIAFDGDADRCFVVDEQGTSVSPCTLLAWMAERLLSRSPNSTVVHDLLTSAGTIEIITEAGGAPVRSRVGHAFVKQEMETHGAALGGEASGHYYFGDFWHADSGPLAALHVLEALGHSDQTVSQATAPYRRYASSGEVNRRVTDAPAALAAVEEAFKDRGFLDHLDGLTVSLGNGRWFNLRPSNIEPVVRLTAEAPTNEAMAQLRDEVLALLLYA